MLSYLEELCAICGVSGDEDAVRDYLTECIAQFPDILEVRTDALGNLLVHKRGKVRTERTILIGAHMDEVGLLITGIRADGTLSVAAVGGVDADVVLGRNVMVGRQKLPGVIGSTPIHLLSAGKRDEKPKFDELYADIGAKDAEEAKHHVSPGDSIYFMGEYTALGGGRVMAKAIDDRFGCAVMLKLLSGEIPCDAWFAFFVQEEIGLRGSRTAAYAINPDIALILEATTAADLDGVTGDAAVCRLGGGPVVSFMDRSTIYDKELYRMAFAIAQDMGIPCQTKSRIAGGNDAGAVHVSRGGVRTLAISVPCRCLHSPSCTTQVSDMEQCMALTERLMEKIADDQTTGA
ncbi:MAG: M42 family metallopeptidase [Ruminococcus sp.]|nr:M42 family metallopeptidase [Ruminococcus sp.]